MKACAICPRKCGADRLAGKRGYCRAGLKSTVYSYCAHHGEEPPISGRRGSGTIFFSFCNMKCVYCQNYRFSQLDEGSSISAENLAKMMTGLQQKGCHNINLVNPTHFIPQITEALEIAIEKGLRIPIVYNTGGYDLPDTLRQLEGIVDIYMPDMRYSDDTMAKEYSDAPGYVEQNRKSVIEMKRQVGDLLTDDEGAAIKGLIIRLLALPEDISGTAATLKYIKDRIGKGTYLSIMSQYHPVFKARGLKPLSRGVARDEYKNIVDEAHLLGLNNGWTQSPPEGSDSRFLGANIIRMEEPGDE